MFRVLVTNLEDPPEEIWRDYNQRVPRASRKLEFQASNLDKRRQRYWAGARITPSYNGRAKVRRVAHQFFLDGRAIRGWQATHPQGTHKPRLTLVKPLRSLSNPGMCQPRIALPP